MSNETEKYNVTSIEEMRNILAGSPAEEGGIGPDLSNTVFHYTCSVCGKKMKISLVSEFKKSLARDAVNSGGKCYRCRASERAEAYQREQAVREAAERAQRAEREAAVFNQLVESTVADVGFDSHGDIDFLTLETEDGAVTISAGLDTDGCCCRCCDCCNCEARAYMKVDES